MKCCDVKSEFKNISHFFNYFDLRDISRTLYLDSQSKYVKFYEIKKNEKREKAAGMTRP